MTDKTEEGMVERVARALWRADPNAPNGGNLFADGEPERPAWHDYVPQAVAAIEVVRAHIEALPRHDFADLGGDGAAMLEEDLEWNNRRGEWLKWAGLDASLTPPTNPKET